MEHADETGEKKEKSRLGNFLIRKSLVRIFTLIAAGVMGHISIQVILNVAVVTNTIPNTGITLPFVSYGGTSILFLLAEMGLVLGISRKC